MVTGGAQELKCNSHTVKKMTKVPQGFDFSFLNDEEARKILQVLERNEKLQRAEKDRISKLQKTKRDIRWLQGVTGEWFEEIQRKKFCNETDVSQMLKQPLTYRLRKEMAKNELQTSRSKNLTNQRNPTSVPSRLNFRSSLASLFSFRKSGKETSKLQSQGQKGWDSRVGSPVSAGRTAGAKIHNSALENQPVKSAFVPKPAVMREESGMPPPWDAPLLENEFFQVLDDLDSKLAQEQASSTVNTRTPLNCGSRTQFSDFYSTGNRHGNITGRHKNHYSETSNMSIYDILRPRTPREGFKTFSSRTRTIYDMYRTREPRILKEDYVQKNTFGSTSLCFDSRQRSAFPATGRFTTKSLHFPSTTQNKSGFVPPRHQQSPKRTPLSSIIWNRVDSSGDRQTQEECRAAPSPMEIDPADQYRYPRCLQENRRYGLYHSQDVYQGVSLNARTDNAMIADTFENSENVPFYHQNNPFARSFFRNTFGRSREQRFGQSPFGGHQEEHSSWSDIRQRRKSFTSDGDFEMISTEANSTSACHGHSVSSEHWESFSSGYGTNVSRGQEKPHPWQFDFQASSLESMELSQDNRSQVTPHFSKPNVCSMTGSSYHIRSGGLEYQQGSSPVEVHINKETDSFGIAQTVASSFKSSFPQIPDGKGNPQSPNFQNPTVTLQKIISDKPATYQIRSPTEVTVTNRHSVDSSSFAESQPDILVTEVNNEKEVNESFSEDDRQLSTVDQTNMTGEIPQPVSQTVTSNPLPDSQNPLSQDSAKSSRFNFNVSDTMSSKRSPRVFSRKDSPKMYTSHKNKSNEHKEDKRFTGDRKFGLAAPFPFIQESGTASFSRPNQDCHQTLTVGNEGISRIIANNHWCSEPTANQKAQSPEKPIILEAEGEQCATTHSTNGGRSAAGHKISCDSLVGLTHSSPSNNSFFDALVVPSTTGFSRSPLDKDPSLGEKEERENSRKNQNNHLAVSPSESQQSHDSHVATCDEEVDGKCLSHSPFRNGKGKGKVRRRISCIEKSNKTESPSIPASDSSSLTEVNQSNSKASKLDTIYCTLPRKSTSFLINSGQSGSKIQGASFRNGPPPFQVKNNVEDPIVKGTSNKFCPSSPESVSGCSKVTSDSVPVVSEVTARMKRMKITGSASVRKGPLPFLINRATSLPSQKPSAATGRDEGEKSLVSDTDAPTVTPRPWERIVKPVQSDLSVRDCSLTQRHHQTEHSQECTEENGKIAASKTSAFSLSNEDPSPVCSELSGKESGKTLHKFKTTSMFSVSGDEDNVKCLEVVSIYYTLPRKPSKKFCDLLQRYAQNANSHIESPQVETETLPNALEEDNPNYSTQERSGTPPPENLLTLVTSAQKNSHCLSFTTENRTILQSPIRGPSEPTLQEMVPAEEDISLYKNESKTREIFPDNLAKTPLGVSPSGRERGEKLRSETLHTLLMLQGKNIKEEKSENCQPSSNSGNSGPSSLPAHSEDNIENSHTRSSGKQAGCGIAIISSRNGRSPQKDHTARAIADSSNTAQPREGREEIGTNCQKTSNETLSDSESQVFALMPALQNLQLVEEAPSGEPDPESSQSEARELPQRSQEVKTTDSREATDEMQKFFSDDLEKEENRSLFNHRFTAISKAGRKFSAKDLSPRRHVATIFPQTGNTSGFGHLSLGTPECSAPSPEPTPKSAEAIGQSRLSDDGMNVRSSENPLQVTVMSNREPSALFSSQKPSSVSQVCQNEFRNTSESPPKHENSKAVTVAQSLEKELGAPAQLTFTNLREADFSDHQRRLSSPCPLEPKQKPRISILGASSQHQHRSASTLEWESEPHLYRSKSLKSINVHGDLLRKSLPLKGRERHFSESTSIDSALTGLTLRNEFSVNNGYSRRFKSFSELSTCDENESWALYSSKAKAAPKSATSISRPIDYGIFGKEQQLAFLENVKRSLTQGRLWKPSFLKNPGFLKDDMISPSNPSESLSSNSTSGPMPEGGLSPSEPLNIYEDDPVDSDCDTDTTTDDEYYLDEKDKESEL
ncbi:exophilin-5 isoform X2 [Nycticebus coucang]|uniref:exophilin-5 isoform X2 n=1 Tax=Nycticebus coucang TaxID=9470 RepID=UPI00234C35E3|nr:exophilin-5 isoform X2 [Nycticebus coucang]